MKRSVIVIVLAALSLAGRAQEDGNPVLSGIWAETGLQP